MSEEDVSAVPGRFDESMSVKGATTKATRERQRRIRLNDRYSFLGTLWLISSILCSDCACLLQR